MRPVVDRIREYTGESTVTHYAHPRRLDKTWCGSDRDPKPWEWTGDKATCVVCADFYRMFGSGGWRMGLPQ